MRTLGWVGLNVAFALVYFLCGRFGLSLAFLHESASAVWPPTGVAISAALLLGRGILPGVFAGAFAVNIATEGSVPVVLGIATGNSIEAFAGAWLTRKLAAGLIAFRRAETVIKFAVFAALPATTASATIGVLSLYSGGLVTWNNVGTVWITWWLGDYVSALIVCPLILTWRDRAEGKTAAPSALELVALTVSLSVLSAFLFGKWSMLAGERYPVDFLLIPVLLWAAYRFEQRGAASAAFGVSAIAIYATLRGLGPFSLPDPNTSLLLLQAFMGTITLTLLVLGALVAERRAVEASLKEAEAKLREHAGGLERLVAARTSELSDSVKFLEDVSYSIAHDLRAPLRGVHGLSSILREEYKERLDQSGEEYLDRICGAVERMDDLINDLLEYGRITKAGAESEPVDLQRELNALIVELGAEISAKSAAVEIKAPLPSLMLNRAVLSQVLRNVLCNALKFIPPETPPRIVVWTEVSDGKTRIAIKDNGIGIDPAYHERIFKLFERLHSDNAYPGTGIGLAIVKKGMERLGGRVWVESRTGEGSCFWLEFEQSNRGPTEGV